MYSCSYLLKPAFAQSQVSIQQSEVLKCVMSSVVEYGIHTLDIERRTGVMVLSVANVEKKYTNMTGQTFGYINNHLSTFTAPLKVD